MYIERKMNAVRQKEQVVTFTDGNHQTSFDLYSPQALEILSQLWSKAMVNSKLHYDVKWMGIPIIQFPEDIVMMQELIWKIKPDVIVECGVAHGGSLIFYSSLMEIIGKGSVLGVDIDIRAHNRAAIEAHPLSKRIKLLQGSSIAPETMAQVKSTIAGAETVLVILDSNHSKEHVAKEIQLYKDFVSKDSYLVVMDGAQAFMHDLPWGKPEWKEDNPLKAIEEFLAQDKNFEMDPSYNRLKVTSNPKGFLKRIA